MRVESFPTVGDCIAAWLTAKRHTLREPTWLDYRDKSARYIVPRLGHIPLQRLQPDHLLRFYGGMQSLGLSPRTVRYVHELLHQALQHAVFTRQLSMNPARQVRPSSYKRIPSVRLAPGDLTRLLSVASHDEFAALWFLLATTGMRPSEALALLWCNIDWPQGVIRIDATLRALPEGRWQRFPFRQPGKDRQVTMTDVVRRALQRHQSRQEQLRSTAGMNWQEHNLIFTGQQGGPAVWTVLVRKHLRPLLQRAGLPAVPGYSLRHTCIAAMLESGIDIGTVSRQTGYTSLSALVGAQGALRSVAVAS